MKGGFILALALLTGACGGAPQTQRDLDRIAADYQRQADADRHRQQAEQDTCGLAQNASLMGAVESELRPPANARVICFGCAATMDNSLARLTIQIGADHRVASMRCG